MKKVLSVLLVALFIFSMTACAQDSSGTTTEASSDEAAVEDASVEDQKVQDFSNEEYVFMTAASSLEYFNAHKKGLQDACKELGVKATIVGDDDVDAATMVSLLEATIERGVAGIVLVGHFPDAYAPLIDQAYEKGIPVVLQTIDADCNRICFIGTNYYSYGQQQMDLMAEAIGGAGKIAISTSMDSGQAAVDSLQGMQDRAATKYPDIEIVAVLEDKAKSDTAVSVISACLQANPDLDGIIGAQSVSGIAAVTAVREAGLQDSIKIVAVDRDSATLEAIKNGEIFATMCGKQYSEVYYATKVLFDFNHAKLELSANDEAAGLVGTPQFIDVGSLVINQDNVEYFIGFTYDFE